MAHLPPTALLATGDSGRGTTPRWTRLSWAWLAAGFALTAAAPRAAEPVRLVVVVVVDQMRADYLTRFARHWRGGFRTLTDNGLVF